MSHGSQPAQMDEDVLRAAERVLSESGFEGLTPAAVAAQAGVPAQTIEERWPDPDSLLVAVAHDSDLQSNERMRARLAGLETSAEKAAAMVAAWTLEADWTIWIELWSRALRSPRVAAARQQLDDDFRRVIAEVVVEGQERGEFAAGDPDRLACTIAATIDSFAVLATLQDDTVSPNFMLEECSAAIGSFLGVKLRPGVFADDRETHD